jgi:GT2 family glycosyltransferase
LSKIHKTNMLINNKKKIDLSIVIVNYNSLQFLETCIESIQRTVKNLQYEIIIVDNHSINQKFTFKLSNIKYIINKKNVGFAAANNQGIKVSIGKYVLLLNPDTIVLTNAIEILCRFMEEHPNAGIVGSKILNHDMTLQPSCKNFPSILTIFFENSGLYSIFPCKKYIGNKYFRFSDHNHIKKVDSVMGACLMTKREILSHTGLLDESYFMYGEEVDFCKRVKNAGWDVFFCPDAKIIHYGGQSSKLAFQKNLIEEHKSRILYMNKYFSKTKRNIGKILIQAGLMIRILACIKDFIKVNGKEKLAYKRFELYKNVFKFYLYGNQ